METPEPTFTDMSEHTTTQPRGLWKKIVSALKDVPMRAFIFIGAFIVIGSLTLLVTHAASAIPSGAVSLYGGAWCLDNDHGHQTQGNKIQIWGCNKTGAQIWDFYSDHTVHLHVNAAYCLDVQWAGTSQGTPVWLWPCNGTAAQVWNVMPKGGGVALVNPHANKCLDNDHGHQTQGNKIQIWGCNGTAAQNWAMPTGSITAPAPTPTAVLSASPSSVSGGGSATLSWKSTNATSCMASGGWNGTKALSGTTSTGALQATTTFTLACSGKGGTAQSTATVSVAGSSPTPTPTPTPTPVGSGHYPPNQVGLTAKAVVSLAQPGYLQQVRDATFGDLITRIADQNAYHTSNRELTHNYAKTQVWNADDSLILLDGWDYDTGYLLDGSGRYLRTLHLPDGNHSARWSNVNPNNLYGIPDHPGVDNSGNQLVVMHPKTDTSTNPAQTVLHTFSQFDNQGANMSFGLEEGNFSNDDSLGVVVGWSSAHRSWGVVTFRMTNTTSLTPSVSEIATTWLGSAGGSDNNPDNAGWNNVSAMPKSDGIVIEWNSIGGGINQGIEWMNPAMTTKIHVTNNNDHYDEGLDASGNEMLVMSCDEPGDGSTNACINVSQSGGSPWMAAYGMNGSGPTGHNINLYPTNYPNLSESVHISCRNTQRPGWCYVSDMTNNHSAPIGLGQIYAMKLDGSHTVEVFGVNHGSYNSCSSCNEYSARAVPSQDGAKVIFASDWGKGTSSPAYDYLIQWP